MVGKQEEIIEMFDNIAPSYDRANRIMSLGIDVAWRRDACKRALGLQKSRQLRIVDIACGTGDMILHWEKYTKGREVDFIGIDPSIGMLEVAKEKLKHLIKQEKIEVFLAQAQDLKILPDASADIISIAYGIRNVTEIDRALKEFWRILKPNGILVILEFVKKEKLNFLDYLIRFYTKRILPLIGGLVSKNYKAYAYLPDSIDEFLSSEILIKKIENSGLKVNITKGYSANISTLLIAVKE